MKALLTGHKGFIGKALSNKLKNIYNVVVCLEAKEIQKLSDELIKGVDIVFHVRAIADTSLQNENEMFTYNYSFSVKLFKLCQKHSKKVIYSSSAACYGDGDGKPKNIYGWSKLMAEEFGMSHCDEFIALRYFNVYGPGECHKGKMASVAHQAYRNGKFKIFQEKPKRDFVYIDDVVDANVHAIDSPKGVYEVGSGEARAFEEVLDLMKINYMYHHIKNTPPWYQFYTKSDSNKWMPNWKPKFNIEKGLKNYKNYLDEKF